MSANDSGPTPDEVPGLEPGGGVAPGDTPPDAGQTSGLSHRQPMPSRTVPIIAISIAALFVLSIAVLFLVRVLDLF